SPENSLARRGYSLFLSAMKRHDEAIKEAQRAVELEPLSALIALALGVTLLFAHRVDEAIESLKRCFDLDPNFPGGPAMLASAYAAKGDFAEATRWAEEPLFVRTPFSAGPRGLVYALTGRDADARRMLDELEQLSKKHYVSPHHSFFIHYALGD